MVPGEDDRAGGWHVVKSHHLHAPKERGHDHVDEPREHPIGRSDRAHHCGHYHPEDGTLVVSSSVTSASRPASGVSHLHLDCDPVRGARLARLAALLRVRPAGHIETTKSGTTKAARATPTRRRVREGLAVLAVMTTAR